MSLLYSDSKMFSLLTPSFISKKTTPESLKAVSQLSANSFSGYQPEMRLLQSRDLLLSRRTHHELILTLSASYHILILAGSTQIWTKVFGFKYFSNKIMRVKIRNKLSLSKWKRISQVLVHRSTKHRPKRTKINIYVSLQKNGTFLIQDKTHHVMKQQNAWDVNQELWGV